MGAISAAQAIGALSLDAAPLKAALRAEAASWKAQFARNLHAKGAADLRVRVHMLSRLASSSPVSRSKSAGSPLLLLQQLGSELTSHMASTTMCPAAGRTVCIACPATWPLWLVCNGARLSSCPIYRHDCQASSPAHGRRAGFCTCLLFRQHAASSSANQCVRWPDRNHIIISVRRR